MREYHCDGFTVLKNPSEVGGGFTVAEDGRIIVSINAPRPGLTNNEAELLACYYACLLAENGSVIVTDSRNTLAWVRSGKPKARPDLGWLAQATHDSVLEKDLLVVWRGRGENVAGIYNEATYAEPTNPWKN